MVPTVVSEALAIAGARLAEDEVVRAEELPERARADGVHRARLEVHEDRAGDVAAARRLVYKVDVEVKVKCHISRQDTQRESEGYRGVMPDSLADGLADMPAPKTASAPH